MQIAQYNPQHAESIVRSFAERQGAHIYALACHAALPNALTPDLLQALRVNFQLDKGAFGNKVRWEDGVRLLLSELVEEVGEGVYEMDLELRRQFLEGLRLNCKLEEGDAEMGLRRQKAVATFLLTYYQEALGQSQRPGYSLARTQEITAWAYLDAEVAYKELREEFERLGREGSASERMRLVNLVESLREQFADKMEELLRYARSWQYEIQENEKALRSVMRPLLEAGGPGGERKSVAMPVPQEMYKQLRAEQIARDPLAEADRRISEWKANPKAHLDLSGIGLVELPSSLFFLPEVEVLDLSHNQLELLPVDLRQLKSLRELNVSHNALRYLNRTLSDLPRLERIDLSHNKMRRFEEGWWKNGKLEWIDLSHNRFGSLPEGLLGQGIELVLVGNELPEMPLGFIADAPSNIQQQTQQFAQPISSEEGEGEKREASFRYQRWLRDVMGKMERGEQKVVKMVWWRGENQGLQQRAMPLDNIIRRPIEFKQYGSQGYKVASRVISGRQVGLAWDCTLQILERGIGIGDLGVNPLILHNSVLILDLLKNQESDYSLEMEMWISRLPQSVPLHIAALVQAPQDRFLLQWVEVLKERYNIKELLLLNPFEETGKEYIWDLVADRFSRNPLRVQSRGAYERLQEVLFQEKVLEEMDFANVEEAIDGRGSGYGAYINFESLVNSGDLIPLASSQHSGNFWTPYFMFRIIRNTLLNQDTLPKPDDFVFQYNGQSWDGENARQLIQKAKEWGFLKEDGQNGFAVVNKAFRLISPTKLSQGPSTLLASFSILPPNLIFDLLSRPELEAANYNNTYQSIGVKTESRQEQWEPNFAAQQFQVCFKTDSLPLDHITQARQLIENTSASLPGVDPPEFWLQSTDPKEVPYHLDTLLRIQAREKNSVAAFDRYEWHKIPRLLGSDTVSQPIRIPSKRPFAFVYSRQDFDQAAPLLQRLENALETAKKKSNSPEKALFPYTPDIFQPLQNPQFHRILEKPKRIVLYLTEAFFRSPQCMAYCCATFQEASRDPRHKILLLSPLNLQDGEVWAQWTDDLKEYWRSQMELPCPKRSKETELHPRVLLTEAAKLIYEALPVFMDQQAYLAITQDEEDDMLPLPIIIELEAQL